MNRSILAAIRCSLLFLVPSVTYALSAQWDLDPISGDWNTSANWTPVGVPNGPADTATFGLSNTTNVSISEDTEVNGITFTSASTNPYTITANPGLTLTISGVGIRNNSGITQHVDNFGTIAFSNSATAGSNVSIFSEGGTINFLNTSTAGSATIRNSTTNFFNRSTAGSATIEGGSVMFANNSTAGSATIGTFESRISLGISFGGNSSAGTASILIARTSILHFGNNSTAANSTILTDRNSDVIFSGNSTAGSASIAVSDGTILTFADRSTAGSARIFAFDNGSISFEGSSQGGTAQIEVGFSSGLDISRHNAPGVTIGSLEGEESGVSLGANNLTVGSNNLSTTYSGDIFGTGGSLTKIGTGTLELRGANTYTGNTNVNRGVLQVDGSITSNTFVNHRGTLAGTGTINGNVTNNGRVSPGSAGTPGALTVTGNYTQAQYAHLMIQIAGANAGQFGVLDVLGTANLSGQLDPVLLNGFVPTIGESFTFLNYGAVNGTLFIFNPNIDNLPEHWEVSYFPTYALLAVVAGNVPVPDQGSTFLLLTLGLLGLVTFRRQLLRGQT
jgi:autotransporter-associated beta strand protein